MNRQEVDRRIDAVEKRMDYLDEHGTRGVDGLRLTIEEQGKDISRIEGKLDGLQRAQGVRQTALYLAMLLPVYVALFINLVRK